MTVDVVIPTIGRPSLTELLASLARSRGPRPRHVILVDDRRDAREPLALGSLDADLLARIVHRSGGARGPAAARNAGWRASRATWIAFLDDDVVVSDSWLGDLEDDLRDLDATVAGSYGRVRVPLPPTRRPTDWERNVAGLESASWITADCAFRRTELLAVGGFDERFTRAFREDSDLALRSLARGKALVRGRRSIAHPVGPAPWWISVRLQAGNADDVLMRALHGPRWRARAKAPRGAFGAHVRVVGAAGVAIVACVARRRKIAAIFGMASLAQTALFAMRRIAPGPRTPAEIATLVLTSCAIPFAAVFHRLRGIARLPRLLRDAQRAPRPTAAAVFFDRDGTLIADVPFNADPERVTAMPAAFAALTRLRAAGVPTAIVSNQSGIGLGLFSRADADAIAARVESLLGPLGPAFICPHAPDARCDCRKPRPGLIYEAAAALGVSPRDCVVIGDIGADVEAATNAGARAVLVPTAATRAEEVASAGCVARDLDEAVAVVLGGRI